MGDFLEGGETGEAFDLVVFGVDRVNETLKPVKQVFNDQIARFARTGANNRNGGRPKESIHVSPHVCCFVSFVLAWKTRSFGPGFFAPFF
jgi:hypothetical protein